MMVGIRTNLPPEATVRLQFPAAEAAQFDFGAGPMLMDPARGEPRRTWAFVMTLCFSRHQYVEFVFDRKVMTCLIRHMSVDCLPPDGLRWRRGGNDPGLCLPRLFVW
jgi:hypothetical protein